MNFYNYLLEHDIRLTKQQQLAVNTIDGPVLLLAVPGSGKTTVLVARLGFMIYEKHIDPGRILTLTYTVAATRDMADRFEALFGSEYGKKLEFRTINGICSRIINYYGRRIGKNAFTLVTDDRMTSDLLGRIYQSIEKEYPTESDLKTVRTLITYIKNMELSSEEIKKLDESSGISISAIFSLYQEEMRSNSLMDYDDQMVYALMILKRSPETLSYFQNTYPYICVDEAQDTSRIQHSIINLLAGKTGNLFMVGDEDQSIYGFRAAYPEALLRFEKDHENAKVLLMEENFRSQKKIVEKACHFINQNVLRHEKNMFTKRSSRGEVRTISLRSRMAEYSYLMKVAKDCNKETAVLYRDNESALPLVDLLERNDIPYRIKNMDLGFFTHRTVTDISNIIRFAFDQKNTELFMLIYYKLKTYLSKALAQEACRMSEKHKISVIDAALRYCKLPKGTETSLSMINEHLRKLSGDTADQAISRIQKQMGYNEYLERNKISESKLFILKSLSFQEKSPEGLIRRLGELQDTLREKDSASDCQFILSTIHSSKGLEYDSVYLMDVIDGVFPQEVPDIAWKSSSIRKTATGDDLKALETFEEERRLFYVGATRAKNELYIFEYNNEDTTFLNEFMDRGQAIPAGSYRNRDSANYGYDSPVPVKRVYDSGKFTSQASYIDDRYSRSNFKGGFSGNEESNYKKRSFSSERVFSDEEYREYIDSFHEGVRVCHIKTGEGTVISKDQKKIVIRFDNGKEIAFQPLFLYTHDLLRVLG